MKEYYISALSGRDSGSVKHLNTNPFIVRKVTYCGFKHLCKDLCWLRQAQNLNMYVIIIFKMVNGLRKTLKLLAVTVSAV